MAQTILYYPTIRIPDGDWLRNALLYWDHISSIVPYKNYEDMPLDMQFLQSEGVYRPVYPQKLFESPYANDFVENYIKSLEANKKATMSPKLPTAALPINTQWVRVHQEKMFYSLTCYLRDNGYLSTERNGSWLNISGDAAYLYMRMLAEYSLKCLCDDTVMGTDSEYWQDEMFLSNGRGRRTQCISLELSRFLPRPSMEMSFEDIIYFKKTHGQEFEEFRELLRKLEKDLSSCEDEQKIKSTAEEFKEDWQRALKYREKLFSGKFVFGTLRSFIAMSPALKEGLDQLPISTISKHIAYGGAAAIHVGRQYVNRKNKINKDLSTKGFSYLLRAAEHSMIEDVLQ